MFSFSKVRVFPLTCFFVLEVLSGNNGEISHNFLHSTEELCAYLIINTDRSNKQLHFYTHKCWKS